MRKLLYLILLITLSLFTDLNAKEDFFNEAKNEFDKKNYEESKFLFQRNIVFNPKDCLTCNFFSQYFRKLVKTFETLFMSTSCG